MVPFAGAIFLGAFLLFLVQPLAGRFVLPWFGGSASIWTVCLLFFQSALFVGYVYAHLLNRLSSIRRQIALHLGLLLGALIWLPPVLDAPNSVTAAEAPVLTLLGTLLRDLGPIFILLAATGPLVQSWYYRALPRQSPYWLYALSNLGSLLGLLVYPFVLEPWLTRSAQAWGWAGGFGLFVGLMIWVGLRSQSANTPGATTTPTSDSDEVAGVTWGVRLKWFLLAALGTSFLAATTTALTADVAPVPFLWVLPLVVYLVSFIVTFTSRSIYHPVIFAGLVFLAAAMGMDLRSFGTQMTFLPFLLVHLFCLAVVCITCHGELYRSRPPAKHLTDFYLTLSLGGAIGTSIIAVVAPALTNVDNDLPTLWSLLLLLIGGASWQNPSRGRARFLWAGMIAAILLVPLIRPNFGIPAIEVLRSFLGHQPLMLTMLVLAVIALGVSFTPLVAQSRWFGRAAVVMVLGNAATYYSFTSWSQPDGTVQTLRGFYGLITVMDYDHEDERANARYMSHGTTTHGIQLRHEAHRHYPTSYYTPDSGIGRALIRQNQTPNRHIGVVGLGIGTIASYGMTGDLIRFFEIDENVVTIANEHFNFLSETSAETETVLGDGRLKLAAEKAAGVTPPYDLLVLDAFSSDAVPTHLLTREAFEIYVARLDVDGVIAVNISNRLISLRQVVEAQARAFDLHFAHIIHHPESDDWWQFPSEWILLSPRHETLDTPAINGWTGIAAPSDLSGTTLWTDEFSSILPLLR